MTSITEMMRAAGDRLRAARGPADCLAAVRAAIQEAEQAMRPLRLERQKHLVPRLANDQEAAAAILRIDDEIDRAATWCADLRAAEGQLANELRVAAVAADAEQAVRKRRQVAELRERVAAAGPQIHEAADRLSELFRGCHRDILDLAAAAGDAAVKRAADGLPDMLRSALARTFQIDQAGQPRPDNNYLGLVPSGIGEAAHRTLADHFEVMLDNRAAVFRDPAAALACRDRLARRKTPAIVLPLAGGLFTVLPATNAFTDRAAAETALCSVSTFRQGHALVEWQEVWLLVPAAVAAALERPEPPPAEAA
jgi:hypothetical protein